MFPLYYTHLYHWLFHEAVGTKSTVAESMMPLVAAGRKTGSNLHEPGQNGMNKRAMSIHSTLTFTTVFQIVLREMSLGRQCIDSRLLNGKESKNRSF